MLSHRKRGFSLIELMIAMLIFLTCLLLIYGIFPASMKAVSRGRLVLLATETARKEIEYLKNLPWDELSMDNDEIHDRKTTVTAWINGNESRVTFISYPVISEIFTDPDADEPDIKSIRVMIKYDYGSPVTREEYTKSESLETLVWKQ